MSRCDLGSTHKTLHIPSSLSENRSKNVPGAHFNSISSACRLFINPIMRPSVHGPRNWSRVSFITA